MQYEREMKTRCTSNIQVAKHAGVHSTTVSRAMRNDPQIPISTRQRIKKIAQRLNYSVDPLVSSLAKRQRKSKVFRGILAWIDNFPTPNGSQKISAFKEYFEGAQGRAAELGFQLENVWIGGKRESAYRTSSVLRTRNIQGLLLAPQPHNYQPPNLQWEWFSVLTLGYSLRSPEFHVVTNHQYHTIIKVFRRLLALGYRRIGLVLSLEDHVRTKYNYLAGFLVEENHVLPKDQVPPYMPSAYTFEFFSKWYKKYKPEAIITQNVDTYQWLQALRIKVPQDVGLVGASLREQEKFASGVSQQNEKVGRAAADFLVSLIERNERGIPQHPLNLLCEGKWLLGQCVRRVNQ
jgi:DNA-binding LacI/PurR family transcriptional regulator